MIARFPITPTPELVARNLVRRAGSADPIVIAESLGLAVYRAQAWCTFGADGALYRDRYLYVLETLAADRIAGVVARLVARVAIERHGIVTPDRAAFAREVGAELVAIYNNATARAA